MIRVIALIIIFYYSKFNFNGNAEYRLIRVENETPL